MKSDNSFEGIQVKGAQEHNLKSIDVKIPRNQITVVTGLSGSGKSSLAFDTIYAEGQRRYIESLSSYAKQFLKPLKKPEVESISGLSPAIAIEQKTIGASPRSTVGTLTEVYDFLRLLFARVGTPYCPEHLTPVSSQSPQQIVDEIMSWPKGTKFTILSPVAQGKKGEFLKEFERWAKKGFVRALADGEWMDLSLPKKLAKRKSHDIDLLIDRLFVEEKFRSRLVESINTALSFAKGEAVVLRADNSRVAFSIHASCRQCGYVFPALEPRHFSFNNPRGACEECNGLGYIDIEEEYVDDKTNEEWVEYDWKECEVCKGSRLNERALSVKVVGKSIAELSKLSLEELLPLFEVQQKTFVKSNVVAEKILIQILNRLSYLVHVGTGYLSLERPASTLSGGEAQRIRLATQMGSSLVGVLYVLDEPSIGLHPKDHHKVLEALRDIQQRGNTILMVEHDEDTIRGADHIIDMGPHAGIIGGEVIAAGNLQEIIEHPESLTGQFLSGRKKIKIPSERRPGNDHFIEIINACGNNLKGIDVSIPLGTLTGITGVSGSGKSTLIRETLYKTLSQKLNKSQASPASHDSIEGIEHIDKIIEINQKPIGRTPRSIPATYTGLFPVIRNLYAQLPESKVRGYKPGHFSFNVKGGRCENCQGMGKVKLEMHFLADVFVGCEICQGKRYNREVLNIKFKEKSIADVLSMSVSEALEFFENHKHVYSKLLTLKQVGLEYIKLGQNSKTLSGGEAQRVKLSKELSKRSTGKTLYILDEPTTGLHFADIQKLIQLLQKLVEQGNTVVVIEHNMDVIKSCDYLLDIGPEGGVRGGELVASGTPEEVAQVSTSFTGEYLKKALTL